MACSENSPTKRVKKEQRWLDYFTLLDSDKSGFVDLADLATANKTFSVMFGKPEDSAEVVATVAAYRKFFESLIKEFDANKDGKVSKEELLAGVEKSFIGKKPADLPAWWKANVTAGFNMFDFDNDGILSVEEVTAIFQRISPKTSAEDLKRAYEWVVKQSPSGKYDGAAYSDIVIYSWATSPDNVPEVATLTPYLRPY